MFAEFNQMRRQMDRMFRDFESRFGMSDPFFTDTTSMWNEFDRDMWSAPRLTNGQQQQISGGGSSDGNEQKQQLTSPTHHTKGHHKKGDAHAANTTPGTTTTTTTNKDQQLVSQPQQGQHGLQRRPHSGDWLLDPFNMSRGWLSQFPSHINTQLHIPKVDLLESPDKYTVLLDCPGLNKSDVSVEVEGNQLKLSGQHSSEVRDENKDSRYIRMERSSSSFQRVLPLPTNVDTHHITANYESGVLKVQLPKVTPDRKEKSEKIAVQ